MEKLWLRLSLVFRRNGWALGLAPIRTDVISLSGACDRGEVLGARCVGIGPGRSGMVAE